MYIHQKTSSIRLQGIRRLFGAVPRGFSMTELIWVIALTGILAGLAVSEIGSVSVSSRETIAREKLEMLNQGLATFSAQGVDVQRYFPPAQSSYGDEQLMLLSLEYRSPTNPKIGSPYVDPRYRPDSSSSTDDFRIQWNGTMFKLLKLGEVGTGLKVPFDGSDIKAPYNYPSDFRPLGR